jgi:ribosomal protein L35
MPVKFSVVPDDAPEKKSPRKNLQELKEILDNPAGKKMIRDSMALKPISKGKRKKELERLRKSFHLQEDDVNNLKSCLMVKKDTGEIDHVKWRNSAEIVSVLRISKVRASCWDDCYYTEDEMADFQYEAFMEECGLNPEDFE